MFPPLFLCSVIQHFPKFVPLIAGPRNVAASQFRITLTHFDIRVDEDRLSPRVFVYRMARVETGDTETITMSARYAHLSPDQKLSVLDRITAIATQNANSHRPKTATRTKRAEVA